MAQIAQQFDITVVGTTELTPDNKKYLKECIERGTIMDCNVETKTGNVISTSKVIGYSKDITSPKKPTYKVTIVNVTTAALSTVSLD